MLDVARLEGWATLPEAAERLGISKQAMHKLVFQSRQRPFASSEVRKLGEEGAKPVYLLRISALNRVADARAARAELEFDVPGQRDAAD